jgi:hypothetical protein
MDDHIQPHEAAPGTEILIDQGKEKYEEYQHATRGNAKILLVPQPSLTDPNDPLRWPLWKKWLTFANGLFYAFNGAMTGPMMAGGENPSYQLVTLNPTNDECSKACFNCPPVSNGRWQTSRTVTERL